ncbi:MULTISPECIES: PEP-CTERM sorting domain-containing protein [Bradyrhizobium]|uniref:PEP-CTERM protein-sorting domain-containing protein n=2 Tax=Bradyrhizobium TaxID=374 RepID=A0ABY0Q7K4_9BRAD|nr:MULTISPECIES: PEP-CTERM sorting domain-containing protein [Bradyrhizobium]SDJ65015.1 PEP-CTERM protein-sorting domain-containing protein [Bradyrhizobium ottawaense]SEC31344.1 PEP-CTERM protein-sorting domain-containing protein [Bradyrhizobium lablabi]
MRFWVSLIAALSFGASAHASNLIVNGDFSTPNQSGGWSIYSPGTSGWTNANGDGVEIGTSPIYGLSCISAGCQNLEVNANTFDRDYQTITGLTAGATYTLSWLYGGRTSGGPDALEVYWGNTLLTTNSGSVGVWTPNSFSVVADGTSETLTFLAIVTNGLPSYGNEVTNVSLTAAVPEASTWAMMLLGFLGLGFLGFRRSPKAAAFRLA